MTAGLRWAEAYRARVEAHWTPARRAELTAGKELLFTPWSAPELLRAMGLLDAHGALPAPRVRKYRQIHHLLAFLRPALDALPDRSLAVVDAGCGRSALGFLVSWWLDQGGRPHSLLGIDRNPDVIAGCRERAARAGMVRMDFRVADLADGLPDTVDVLLALHACDTATDHALAAAVQRGAAFFAVAPCCQAELARAWSDRPGPLGLLQSNPHLRRTLAATTTDAMRAELMRSRGYDVRAVEFVEAHHTPKNTLLYGHRTGPAGPPTAYRSLVEATGGHGIALEALLP